MNFSMIAMLGLTVALACGVSEPAFPESQRAPDAQLAQAGADAPGGATANNLNGIGLTPSHKRIIYDRITDEQGQTLSGRLAIGDTVPDSVMLNAVPISVKDQVGVLRDFKFVKLMDGKILLVDPTTRKIVDSVTSQDAGR